MSRFLHLILLCLLCGLVACRPSRPGHETPFAHASSDENPHFDLPDIQQQGELIILTLYGPESYFEFRGEDFGLQYLLARHYATSIGASLRVDVSRSPAELVQKLLRGEGDLVAYALALSDSLSNQLRGVGGKELTHFLDSIGGTADVQSPTAKSSPASWLVRRDSPLLAASLDEWMHVHHHDFTAYTTIRVRTSSGRTYTPRRRVSAPILNAARGQISFYDDLFRRHALTCGWDWRLLAAQAYQESAFDAQAVSPMGALGLLQLMPATAREVGVAESDLFTPSANVRGAVQYIVQLNRHYASIADPDQRLNFVLAAYNAGPGHVDDARALARKQGLNPDQWQGHVDAVVLRMSQPDFYNQPEVRHGYFRGSETYNYVASIRARWQQYRDKIKTKN